MERRFVALWFPYLKTDWFTSRLPRLAGQPFVLQVAQQGKMLVSATNYLAEKKGVFNGMVMADAHAIIPGLQTAADKPMLFDSLLRRFAAWCIRFSPVVAIDEPDGIIIDASGCPHLWGGEVKYLEDLTRRIKLLGYTVHTAMAGTVGTAWALSRYGTNGIIVKNGAEMEALLQLPPEALRIETDAVLRLCKLGLRQVRDFITMPRKVLQRRFGDAFMKRLHQALGFEWEPLQPVEVPAPYHERLQCLEPIVTLKGIEMALQQLLANVRRRLLMEGKGMRTACLKCYRVDGQVQKIEIGFNAPSVDEIHAFKLFELKLGGIASGLGIELFALEVTKADDLITTQDKLWQTGDGLQDNGILQLLDRLANKIGLQKISRYLPDAHYWPERSIKQALSVHETAAINGYASQTRPVQLLSPPEPITVTAPVPDYPPMQFRHKGRIHKIIRADGPERIEQEWWLQEGAHRDYYYVEDTAGCRYWLFRSGHYDDAKSAGWFLHGYCA
jgi:protein ImuB